MAGINEYKCPCCGGGVEFNAGAQKLKCPYCDTEFDMDIVKAYDEQVNSVGEDKMDWNAVAGSEWGAGEADGLRAYVCKSCGGEIIGEETTGSMSCPYCDKPIVMTGQFSGALKPDYIIPFKLDKKQAKEALKKHMEGKKLLPKVFKDENHIDEIKGLYVPFWVFDAKADAAINYKGTKDRTWSDNDFNYRETSYYLIQRAGDISFEKVPVDGSVKMPDDLMESLEPFNFKDATSFSTAYLAGYVTDKYDVDAANSIPRANTRIKTSTENAFRKTVQGYKTVETEKSSINLTDSKAHYCLFPVWLLNTTWNGQKYTFAMNGQTGKFVGDLPVDKNAYKNMFLKVSGIAAAVTFAAYSIVTLFILK